MKVSYVRIKRSNQHIIFIPNNAETTHLAQFFSSIQLEIISVGQAFVEIDDEGGFQVTAKDLPNFEYWGGNFTEDCSIIQSMFDNPGIKFKYIRSQGFNKSSENLIFLFDEGFNHRDAANLLTFGIPSRCVSAGFALNSPQAPDEFKIANKGSDSLDLKPLKEIDEVTEIILESSATDEELLHKTIGWV